MSELKVINLGNIRESIEKYEPVYYEYYAKSEADKMIAEKDAEIRRLKNSIAPKQSDRTLQERLNEVCEKHGVSTLQDLDWALCESEKRHTKDNIEAAKEIRRLCRALWLARVERAMAEVYSVLNDVPTSNRWIKARDRLNTKAEEYKR